MIRSRLEKDSDLNKRTLLTVDDIIELLRFVLTTTYFLFRGNIYKQRFGAAMGSPVSPVVANLYMEFLEQQALLQHLSTVNQDFESDTSTTSLRSSMKTKSTTLQNISTKQTPQIALSLHMRRRPTIVFHSSILASSANRMARLNCWFTEKPLILTSI